VSESEQLSEIISSAAASWESVRSANVLLKQFCEANGIRDANVALASCRGGTQRLYARLYQGRVRGITDLSILLLDRVNNLDAVVRYVMDAFEGRKDCGPPAGPVAFAQEDSCGLWTVRAIVVRVPTPASSLAAEAHEARVINVQDEGRV